MATLSISAAWEETVAFVRREGRLLFPVSFMLVALPSALTEALTPPAAPNQPPEAGPWLALFPIALLLSAVGNIAISTLALRPGTSVGEALRRGAARLLPLIAIGLLAGIALFVLFVLLAAVVLAAVPGALDAAKAGVADAQSAKAVLLAAFLLCPVVLYFGARLLVLTPLAAGEEGGPLRLIGRSWSLTAGHAGRLVATLLLVIAAYLAVFLTVQSLAGLAVIGLIGAPTPGSLAAFLITLVGAGITTLATPYLATFFARIYAQLAG